MTSLSQVADHQNAVYSLHYRQHDISVAGFYLVMWYNWKWFRGLLSNCWWDAPPQYAIKNEVGGNKQTKINSFSDKRTEPANIDFDLRILWDKWMFYKTKILPVLQHCIESKDVTIFRQAWHTFWSLSSTKEGQQSTLNTISLHSTADLSISLITKAGNCHIPPIKLWNCL